MVQVLKPFYRMRSMIITSPLGSRSILSSIAILLFLVAFSAKEKCQTTASSHVISGTVYNSEGLPIGGLEVMLYSDIDQYPDEPRSLISTSSDGTFEFIVEAKGHYLLEINGEKGKGRVLISPETQGDKLEIIYPVTKEIVILHTNDPHFDINKTAALSKAIQEVRGKYDDVYLFSAGDIFVRHPARWIVNGTLMEDPEWYLERALLMINTMNSLGYDLLTLGNHELAYREKHTRMALETAAFPILSANFEISTDELPPVEPYAIFTTSTWRKIAVLGLSIDNANQEGIKELDLEETVRSYLHLKNSSEIFIALSHRGLRNDSTLAKLFPEFDVIVGGHSHHLIKEAITVNSVLVAQAGGNPHTVSDDHPVYLGKIVLTLENGVIRDKRGWVMAISDN
jgi:hypothetical protein